MNLPGAKRLTFWIAGDVVDEICGDLLILLEGEPLPEPDEKRMIHFDFVGRDISFAPIVERVMATPGVSVVPVF